MPDSNWSINPKGERLPSLNIAGLLKEKGYKPDEIKGLLEKDILFFSTRTSSDNKELLTLENVELKKTLSNEIEKLDVEFPLDKIKEHEYLELLHAEIVIGVIVFLSITAWEIAKGVISNWIYDRFERMRKQSKRLDAKIEIQVTNKRAGQSYHIKYSGPADEVAKIVKETKFE